MPAVSAAASAAACHMPARWRPIACVRGSTSPRQAGSSRGLAAGDHHLGRRAVWRAADHGDGLRAGRLPDLHWLAAIAPQTFVFNLETGYQFPETLALRDRIAARYGLEVALERPETTVEEYERQHGGPLYRTEADRCCGDRKLAVIRRVLTGFDAWMSGIRRDQSPDRAAAPIVGWDAKFGVVKISPLANWTKARVWETIVREDVPYNPLHDQGYVSIGCAPCTRPVSVGEDERAGRWSGTAKTECGLHSHG